MAHSAIDFCVLQLAAESVVLARTQYVLNVEDSATRSTTPQNPPPATKSITNPADPSTSTPVKPGMQFSSGDLVGPVLELPETTNPYKLLCDTYKGLYEYFGDSLAGRLPHHFVKDYYSIKREEPRVSFGDTDSKKSGEELLQQFLNVKDVKRVEIKQEPHRNKSDADVGIEMEHDSQILEQNADDIDFEGDEKSIRSERSSRSSRSERSHSDENDSYMGEDTDLTVKATVSESLGIKLTITKRPKLRLTDDEEGGVIDKMNIATKMESKKRRQKDSDSSKVKVRKEPLVSLAFEQRKRIFATSVRVSVPGTRAEK